jgi:hypothetical protein
MFPLGTLKTAILDNQSSFLVQLGWLAMLSRSQIRKGVMCMEDKDKQNDNKGHGNGNDDHGNDRNDDRGREVKPPRPHSTPLNDWCS